MVKNHKEFDYNNQTRLVKDRNDGARISNWNNKDTLISNCFEEKTLYEFFLRGQRVSSKFFLIIFLKIIFLNNFFCQDDGDCLGWRSSGTEPFKWLKYSQVNAVAEKIGSAFIKFGLEPARETFIGIFAKNRPEWSFTEKACNAYSFVSVPLYDTFGVDAINFILNQSNL